MPEGIGIFNTFPSLVLNLNDIKRSILSSAIKDLGNNLKKIDLSGSAYYWYEINNEVVLGCELDKAPQGLVVLLAGKNPTYKGKPPFASDLYNLILKDSSRGIRLMSDDKLSDEGYAIWARLFSMGHKVSIYDKTNPANTFKTFDNLAEFESYFKKGDPAFKRYQYVLTENVLSLLQAKMHFRMRKYREDNNLGVKDYGEE